MPRKRTILSSVRHKPFKSHHNIFGKSGKGYATKSHFRMSTSRKRRK